MRNAFYFTEKPLLFLRYSNFCAFVFPSLFPSVNAEFAEADWRKILTFMTSLCVSRGNLEFNILRGKESMILKFWQLIKDYIRKLFTVNKLKLVPDIFGKKVKIRQCIQKGLLHIVQFERVLSKILGIRLR